MKYEDLLENKTEFLSKFIKISELKPYDITKDFHRNNQVYGDIQSINTKPSRGIQRKELIKLERKPTNFIQKIIIKNSFSLEISNRLFNYF